MDLPTLQAPVDEQRQNDTKQCNGDKTAVQMGGFGRSYLFSVNTHLEFHTLSECGRIR